MSLARSAFVALHNQVQDAARLGLKLGRNLLELVEQIPVGVAKSDEHLLNLIVFSRVQDTAEPLVQVRLIDLKNHVTVAASPLHLGSQPAPVDLQ